MGRFGRYILNGLTAISLLFFLTLTILWIRSYNALEEVRLAYSGNITTDGYGEDGGISGYLGGIKARWYQGDINIFCDYPLDPKPPYHYGAWARGWSVYTYRCPPSKDPYFGGIPFIRSVVECGPFSYEGRTKNQLPEKWRALYWGPIWIAWGLAGILPLARIGFIVIRKVLRRNRHQTGCCEVCGYDLRATPEKCPECGTPVIRHRSTLNREAEAQEKAVK